MFDIGKTLTFSTSAGAVVKDEVEPAGGLKIEVQLTNEWVPQLVQEPALGCDVRLQVYVHVSHDVPGFLTSIAVTHPMVVFHRCSFAENFHGVNLEGDTVLHEDDAAVGSDPEHAHFVEITQRRRPQGCTGR